LMSAPEGMALTSGEHLQMTATKNVAINAGGDISAGVMGNMTAQAGEQLGLFARTGQLSLKAGEGAVEVQAQNASIRLFAEKKLTMSSASDIDFAGKKRITLIGGGSYLRLEAGKIKYGTTAMYLRRTKRTMAAGANSITIESKMIQQIHSLYNLQFKLNNSVGNFVPHASYLLIDESGEITSGITDENGYTNPIYTNGKKKFSIHIILNQEDESE
uniref:DUF2345 domain-containing protein n=1 Tax=uncultured Enterobacter sp. TaxID=238202 RepID=UPI00261CE6E1